MCVMERVGIDGMMDWIDVDSCVALVRIPRAVPLHAYPTGGRSVGSAGDQI